MDALRPQQLYAEAVEDWLSNQDMSSDSDSNKFVWNVRGKILNSQLSVQPVTLFAVLLRINFNSNMRLSMLSMLSTNVVLLLYYPMFTVIKVPL